jgi:hypothetical protein
LTNEQAVVIGAYDGPRRRDLLGLDEAFALAPRRLYETRRAASSRPPHGFGGHDDLRSTTCSLGRSPMCGQSSVDDHESKNAYCMQPLFRLAAKFPQAGNGGPFSGRGWAAGRPFAGQ